jgi:gliding motility-associated-like protein
MKRYLLFLSALCMMLPLLSQEQAPEMPSPVAYVIDSAGETVELAPGDDFSGEAPVTVRLAANAAETDGFSLVIEWSFTREGEDEPYLVRRDADVEIEIKKSGATVIQPKIIYTSTSNSEVYWEFGAEAYEPFRIVLAESSLEVPNAFSPNGDGINDYFNVYNAKSLISFHAAIFNRWGQQLYSWGLDGVGCEECGWDGTYKGQPVKAGVYYVVVKAKGADGIEYEYRKDVNLLRGYNEESGN